jgi:hypothetical protein
MTSSDDIANPNQAVSRRQLADLLADLLNEDELRDAIAQRLEQRLQEPQESTVHEPQILATQTYARHGRLIWIRQTLSIAAAVLLVGCSLNTLNVISVPDRMLGIPLSMAGIGCGLGLVALLVTEVFLGAGTELEVEMVRGGALVREYKFMPSIHRLPFVLALLAVGFFAIVLGFSSLYAELVRLNPSHFFGLDDGFLSIYFALVTFSTVGFGDIHPVSMMARGAVTCEIAIAMFFSLVALSTTLSWITAYERQRHEEFVKQRVQTLRDQRSSPDESDPPRSPNPTQS